MPEHRAYAYAAQVKPVQLGVARRREIIRRLGHPIHIGGRGQVVLVHRALPESLLNAVHRDRAGIYHALNIAPARRLKDIVRPLYVHLHPKMRAILRIRRQQRRHMDNAPHIIRPDSLQQMRQPRNIPAIHAYPIHKRRQIRARRREIKAHHIFPALRQLTHNAPPNKPRPPRNHYRHTLFPFLMLRCCPLAPLSPIASRHQRRSPNQTLISLSQLENALQIKQSPAGECRKPCHNDSFNVAG